MWTAHIGRHGRTTASDGIRLMGVAPRDVLDRVKWRAVGRRKANQVTGTV